ncbi:disulfide bond formation protein B [Donghicola sp. C2-DW-16]|uniref:Disulfide bond formation protein B n=1 Tax=Donghicola mangrovi TaxID=2729614 RepID=A0A850Q492_9RHOB|nr:disulfide bond formation protein B [Donghicola mangrovi]NVO22862.1 disulfide bond formation protein B [Donghicola mangrovi]NVO27809.1 disulfide bond formation protein B [Donghicola mangrovi]
MTQRTLIGLAAFGSLAILLGAFGFQYIGGYPPCAMCLWQRWPHAAAILLGAVGVMFPSAIIAWLGALAAAVTSGIGVYHAGVEQKLWQGPTSCTGSADALSGMNATDLLSLDGPTGVVMCDAIVWDLFGITMAGYNAIFSALFCLIWIAAARAKH